VSIRDIVPPRGVELVEVVDPRGRPLAVVSAWEAHRQSLPHRAALVIFRQGRERVVLGRRPAGSPVFPGRWDFTARGHVRPGEAVRDAAKRLADAAMPGLAGPPLFQAALPPGPGNGFEALSVFHCALREGPGVGELESLAVDREELGHLAAQFRDLLAPGVVQALESGVLFDEPGPGAD